MQNKTKIKVISSLIHVQKCKIMYNCAPFFKAKSYQRFIESTVAPFDPFDPKCTIMYIFA